ncbi:hypothetical protein VTK56DRAFT_2747 [Thermocarpiscus australiensis]
MGPLAYPLLWCAVLCSVQWCNTGDILTVGLSSRQSRAKRDFILILRRSLGILAVTAIAAKGLPSRLRR